MPKVRDYQTELETLGAKCSSLEATKVRQLGELVTATGAGSLDVELIAGVLLAAVEANDADAKEAWRAKGADFFQQRPKKTVLRPRFNEPCVNPDRQGDSPP